MAREAANNIRLGIFVTVASALLIIALYLVGKKQNLFGASYTVRARFSNVNGLMAGNNVRYSGIQAGTIKDITVINDTTIEVTMLIQKKMRPFISQNSLAAIGNEGLMGNKVINITPGNTQAAPIKNGGLLVTRRQTGTDEMLETLSGTNVNAAEISEQLKRMLVRINNSNTLWAVLDDSSLSKNIHSSVADISNAANRINELSGRLNAIVADVQQGKGTAGKILKSDELAGQIKEAVANVNRTVSQTEAVVRQLDSITGQVNRELATGKGVAHTVLKDTAAAGRLSRSLANIEKGTASFDQNMEALKHNVLTRGYFRKEARKKKKQAGKTD